ncbi:MAG TPA: lasso peptide biosynthesis B2 protein [Gemmatimonadales bacterium]|nr:lasso peptide biosynthesis B2 protein [Gemmatimonadales bacterium]
MSRIGIVWPVRIAVAILVIPPLVHLVPMDRLTRWLARLAGRPREAAAPDSELARWVDAALRRLPWPWHLTCLKRTAVLFYVLGRAGRPVELRIGVRHVPGDPLTAHAWLVRDGAVILEPGSSDVSGFETIARFPEISRGEP